jgi:hypothetical protein
VNDTQVLERRIRSLRRRLTREADALRRQRKELAIINVTLEGVTFTPVGAALAYRIRKAEERAKVTA